MEKEKQNDKKVTYFIQCKVFSDSGHTGQWNTLEPRTLVD